MSPIFPSTEYFRTLQQGLEDPAASEGLEPSDAYCGLRIDSSLFVLEFDGRQCAAVVSGGNPIDLDFVVGGSLEAWRHALGPGSQKLTALLSKGELVIETEADDGQELAKAALPMLQAFLDRGAEIALEVG